MGIPSYYKYITSNYDNLIFKETLSVNRLFLDLNGCIHPCAQKIIREYPNLHKNDLEKKIMIEVLNFIIYIFNFTKPSDLLYIAIDGVAPRAKMQQQRYRRYKSSKEKEDKKKLLVKFDKIDDKNDWDTNAITPGTLFMSELSKYLRDELPKKTLNVCEILLSDSNDIGEGEHKIFNYIRHNIINNSIINVVYGLDADLIMLSMSIHNSNIYLLRETLEFGNIININEEGMPIFLYFIINNFKESIISHLIQEGLNIDNIDNKYRHIYDYIFICFLLGNDFLPHILSLGIKNGGINILLEFYIHIIEKNREKKIVNKSVYNEKDINKNNKINSIHNSIHLNSSENKENESDIEKNNKLLINNTNNNIYLVNVDDDNIFTINEIFFIDLIDKLVNIENEVLQSFTKSLLKYRIPPKNHNNKYEKELYLNGFLPIFNRDIDKYINYGFHNWRQRYYESAFQMETQLEINSICHHYIQGLIWTLKYYFEKCYDYKWYYPFRHPPSLYDIKLYLENNKIDINNSIMENSDSYKPFEQLLIVLPSSSYNLLPPNIGNLMIHINSNIIDFYPLHVELDTITKIYTWQCYPILPFIDEDRLFKTIKNIELTKEEDKRNEITPLYKIQ